MLHSGIAQRPSHECQSSFARRSRRGSNIGPASVSSKPTTVLVRPRHPMPWILWNNGEQMNMACIMPWRRIVLCPPLRSRRPKKWDAKTWNIADQVKYNDLPASPFTIKTSKLMPTSESCFRKRVRSTSWLNWNWSTLPLFLRRTLASIPELTRNWR